MIQKGLIYIQISTTLQYSRLVRAPEHQPACKDSSEFKLELVQRPILAADTSYLCFGDFLLLYMIPYSYEPQLPTITNAEWESLAYSRSLIFLDLLIWSSCQKPSPNSQQIGDVYGRQRIPGLERKFPPVYTDKDYWQFAMSAFTVLAETCFQVHPGTFHLTLSSTAEMKILAILWSLPLSSHEISSVLWLLC